MNDRRAPPLARLAACLLAPALALAQGPDRAGVERKLELLASYLDSSAARRIDSGDHGDARALLEQAREAQVRALAALEEGRVDEAATLAGDALRVFSRATMSLHGAAARPEQRRDRAQGLRAEIDAYRKAFREGLAEKGPAAAGLLDERALDRLLTQADAHGAAGRDREAEALLVEAQQVVATALTRLRRNETVVYSLEFRTPADEYRYERERARGFALLVEHVGTMSEPSAGARKLVDRFLDNARKLEQQAASEADAGDFAAAVRSMEEANRSYMRALQSLGVPVSG
ncbi:MAG: hypothetical protein H6983_13785 [Ectothiorhodospiraceae bacterium]|nr:hypothetical protein [Ectothiorhodospiraceae bacterium]